jgi:hypothetical protein
MPEGPQEEPEQGEDDHEPSLLVRLDEATAQINLVSLARHYDFFVRMHTLMTACRR